MKNVIPKMTHRLGKYWVQPSPEDIAIDDDYAMMTSKTLSELPNYSSSSPSGVYEGKMWKCKRDSVTYLLWYSYLNANACTNNYRKVLLCD